MARFIDLDQALELCKGISEKVKEDSINETMYTDDQQAQSMYRHLCTAVFQSIDVISQGLEKLEQPEVKPVVHARMKYEYADNGWADHICTNCGYTKNTDVHVSLSWSYCPSCGAKLDSPVRSDPGTSTEHIIWVNKSV